MKLGIFSLWTDSRDHELVYGETAELTPDAPAVAIAAQTPRAPRVSGSARATRAADVRASEPERSRVNGRESSIRELVSRESIAAAATSRASKMVESIPAMSMAAEPSGPEAPTSQRRVAQKRSKRPAPKSRRRVALTAAPDDVG